MGLKKETAEVEIRLNTAEAQRQIKDMTSKSVELEKALKQIGGDDAARKKMRGELDAVNKELLELRKSVKTDLRVIINGEDAGANLRELKNAQALLTREMLLFGDKSDPVYIEMAAKLKVLSQRIIELEAPLKDAKKAVASLGEEGSMNVLQAQAKALREEVNSLEPSSKRALAAMRELEVIENTIKETEAATTSLKGEFVEIGEIGSFNHLTAKAEALRQELKGMTVGTEAYIAKSRELAAVELKLEAIKNDATDVKTELAGMAAGSGSFDQLKAKAEALRNEINRLTPATQEFISKSAQLQQVEAKMESLNNTIRGTGGLWSTLKDQFKQFGLLAAGYLGFQALTSQVQNIISKNAQLSDSLADVKQTTGLTTAEIAEFSKELSKIDTRTAKADLLDIAKVGGQFGVAKSEIKGFTEAINEATVVLKSEFKGGAEEITSTLAGLRNVLTDVKTDDISTDLRKLSNVLIVLAQQGNATAPVVSDIANRIAGIGRSVGLSSGQILGLSATLQELNINSERGGTAVGRLLQKMTTNTAEFARIAGVPLKDFHKLVNEDIYGAFVKFLEGTKKFKGNAIEMGGAFKELETTGVGVTEVVTKVGQNIDLLTEKVNTSSDAIQRTTELQEQYKIKNTNLAAELEKLQQKIYGVFANDSVRSFFTGAVSGASKFIDSLKSLFKFIGEYKEAIALTGVTILSFIKGTEATERVNKRLAELFAGQVTDALDKAKKGFEGLWASMKANPLGAVMLAVEVATTIFFALRSAQKAHREELALASKAQNEYNEKMRDSQATVEADFESLRKTNVGSAERRKLLEEINSKYKEYLPNLLDEKSGLDDIAIAQDAVNKKLTENIILEDDKEKRTALIKKRIELEDQERRLKEGGFLADEQGHLVNYASVGAELLQIKEKIKLLDELRNARLKALKDGADIDQGSAFTLPQAPGVVSPKPANANSEIKNPAKDLSDEERAKLDAVLKVVADHNAKMKQLYYDLERVHIQAIKEGGERELAELDLKHQQEIDKIKQGLDEDLNNEKLSASQKAETKEATNNILLAKETEYQDQRKSLVKKYSDELSDAEFKQDIKNLDEWTAKRKLAITKSFADGVITQQQYAEQNKELEKQALDYKLQILKDYGLSSVEAERLIAEMKAGIHNNEVDEFINKEKEKLDIALQIAVDGSNQQLELQLAQIKRERDAKLEFYKDDAEMQKLINAQTNKAIEDAYSAHIAKLTSTVQDLYSAASTAVSNYLAYVSTKENNELAHDKRINEQKKNNLKQQLDGKKLSQEEYDKQIQQLEDQYQQRQNALRKKQFKREQTAAIVEAVISAALAAVQAWNTAKGNPYVYAALAALISASATAEIALIASQKPPEYGKGKRAYVWPGKGGKPEGPSHKDGGIDLVDTQTGSTIGNMEGNEPILSEKTYINNRTIVDKLLDSSLNKDGKQIEMDPGEIKLLFEKGGFLFPENDGKDKPEQNIFENYLNSLMAVLSLKIPVQSKSILLDQLTKITTTTDQQSRFEAVYKLQETTTKIAAASKVQESGNNVSSILEDFGVRVRLLANTTAGKPGESLVSAGFKTTTPDANRNTGEIPIKHQVNPGLNRNSGEIPIKHQVNPGVNRDIGTTTHEPHDQKGLVNKVDQNRGIGSANDGGGPLDQKGLVNKGAQNRAAVPDVITKLLTDTSTRNITSVPQFASVPLPQLNERRLSENIEIGRHGYSNATGTEALRVQPPVKQEPNKSTTVTVDPFQQEMLQTMSSIKVLLQMNVDTLQNPVPQKNYVLTQDIDKAKELINQVKKNSQVG